MFDERQAHLRSCGGGLPPDQCFPDPIPTGTPAVEQRMFVDAANDRLTGEIAEFNAFLALGWITTGLGTASILISVFVLAGAPTDDAIEDAARARLEWRPSLRGVELRGAF